MSISESDLGLLAAGFSAILGFQVVPPQQTVQQESQAISRFVDVKSAAHGARPMPKIGVEEVFDSTYKPYLPTQPDQPLLSLKESAIGDVVNITVKMINGGSTTVQATKGETVKDVLSTVQRQIPLPYIPTKLTTFGRPMSPSQPIGNYLSSGPQASRMILPPPGVPWTMPSYKAFGGGPTPAIHCLGGEDGPYQLDTSQLDPPYNYDFSDEKDDGRVYTRGGYTYKRPYGWKRFAVKVLGRYNNNTWLGLDGIRTEESKDEWPVSYHGSGTRKAVDGILDEGYYIGSGNLYGDGVYTSPSIEWYEDPDNHYTAQFQHNGHKWMVLLQNRVNPDIKNGHLKIQEKTWAGVPFWISPLQNTEEKVYDVRPYGILFKTCD